MNIALLNLTNNVTNYSTTPSGETIYIKRILQLIGYTVTIISNKTGEHTVSFEDAPDINSFDKLLVMNGSINFFGGNEHVLTIKNYMLMAKYKKTIFYFLTDGKQAFKQVWPNVENRDWGKKYTKEDLWVTSDMVVVSQMRDLSIAKKCFEGIDIVKDFVVFPIEQYKLVLEGSQPYPSVEEKTADIIYGGTFRGGSRLKKMGSYFFDMEELKVVLFGSLSLTDFFSKGTPKIEYTVAPEFIGKIPMDTVSAKNSSGFCSIILGEKNYNDNIITLRVWETMLSDAICFIEDEFDSEHVLLPDNFYFKTKKELIAMVRCLKRDDEKRKQYISIQHNRVTQFFNKEIYLHNLEVIVNSYK